MKRRNCPYLGLQYDSSTCHAFSSEHNFCHKVSVPGPVDLDYQSAVCLTADYIDCPIYNGVEQALPSQADTRLRNGALRYGCIFVGIALFSVIVALIAPILTGSSGVRTFMQLLGQPTPETFHTPTLSSGVVALPAMTETPALAESACLPPTGWAGYTLQGGDDLVAIASQRGVDLAAVQQGNCNLDLFTLVAGDIIFLPLPSGSLLTATPTVVILPSETPFIAPSATASLVPPTVTVTPLPTETPTPTITNTIFYRPTATRTLPPPTRRPPRPPNEPQPTQPEERPTEAPPTARP